MNKSWVFKDVNHILFLLIGSVVEWYDYAIYGFIAPILGPLFFPSNNHTTSILAVFAVFAVGFLIRPLGAVIYGHLGDTIGRKKTLIASILLMGVPTLCMGLLPTYNTIGIWAPIGLIIVRLLQGLSVGGEFTGSSIYIIEHAKEKRFGFLGSLAPCAAFSGMLLASVVGALLSHFFSHEQMIEWGWRLPFLLGILVTTLGWYMRKKLIETPEFEQLEALTKVSKHPIIDSFAHHLTSMLKCVGLCWATAVVLYLVFIFMPTYLVKFLHVPLSKALFANTINMVILVVVCVLSGIVADIFFKRINIIKFSLLLIALIAFPIYKFIVANPADIIIGQMLLTLASGILLGQVMTELVLSFPTYVRYSALSLSYNLGFGIFGGTVPLVAIYSINSFDVLYAPAYYLIFATLISFVFLTIGNKH